MILLSTYLTQNSKQKIHGTDKTRERTDFMSSCMTMFLKISDFKKCSCRSQSLVFMYENLIFKNYTLGHLKITEINAFYIDMFIPITILTENFQFYSPHKTFTKEYFIIFKNYV